MDTSSGVIGIEELQAKYQRLGLEYQKARAQITVLKKAILEDQDSSKTLKDGLKHRDQTIRKYEQEIDSLHFRNSQLSKRVEILQLELSEYENKGTKPNKQPSQTSSISFIHEQELQMKIAENESLHKQLQEINIEHEIRVNQLKSQLEEINKNDEDYKKLIDDFNSKNDLVIQKLKEERHVLDSKLNKQAEDLRLANVLNEKYKSQFKEDTNELLYKLDNTTKLMQEKLPFIDSEVTAYNVLNVPVNDKVYEQKILFIIECLSNHVISFLSSFSDYHTYLEQRLQVFNVDINQEKVSPVNSKFSFHLLKNALYTRPLQNTLKCLHKETDDNLFIVMNSLTSLLDVSSCFKRYSSYLSKLMSYRLISMEEECRSSTWSESIEKRNHDILKVEKTIIRVFSKLSSYIDVMISQSVLPSSKAACFNQICFNLELLNQCFKNLYEHYVAKYGDEHEFPIYTERLKTTDEFLLSTVVSLEISSGKIFNLLSENSTFLISPHQYKRKGLPCFPSQEFPQKISSFNKKGANYILSLLKSPPSIYAVPQNHSPFQSGDDIYKQMSTSQEYISELEHEKEHWILEHKLLTAKYDKELKNIAMIRKEFQKCQVTSLEGNNDTLLDSKFVDEQDLLSSNVISNDTTKNSNCDMDSQESILKEYMSARISDLTKQLQTSDSKCINFYQEAHSLYRQVILADKNRLKLSNLLKESDKKIENLQDELETTKRSYEEQLGMFSDHLCGMNDKLTSQKDQIDELKTSGSGSSHNFGIFQLTGRKK